MEISQLSEQVRAALVANMGTDLILAYVEKHYPQLAPEERQRLLKLLTSTPIARKGKKTTTTVKREPTTKRHAPRRAKPIPGKGGKPAT
jgi:hypothetical protein